MKSPFLLPVLAPLLLSIGLNSCSKEPGMKKEIKKTNAADCPRMADMATVKSSALYTVSTYAGADHLPYLPEFDYQVNGVLCNARFLTPSGIAISPDGVIYVTDDDNHNIRKISQGIVSFLAGEATESGIFCSGEIDGIGTGASFCSPKDAVLNKEGDLLLIDQSYGSIRKVSPLGQVSTIISSEPREPGYLDGPLAQARFGRSFISMAIGPDGSIYLSEETKVIRRISPEGMVSTYAGQVSVPVNGEFPDGYRDGDKENALFGGISDMAFGPDGSLYLCDGGNQKIRKITPAGRVETVARLTENLTRIHSIAISDKGIIYIANSYQIFRIDADGTVLPVAGKHITPEHRDGVGSQARFRTIRQIATHKNYLYLTDGTTVRRMNIE